MGEGRRDGAGDVLRGVKDDDEGWEFGAEGWSVLFSVRTFEEEEEEGRGRRCCRGQCCCDVN